MDPWCITNPEEVGFAVPSYAESGWHLQSLEFGHERDEKSICNWRLKQPPIHATDEIDFRSGPQKDPKVAVWTHLWLHENPLWRR